jgi:hypothetical protein
MKAKWPTIVALLRWHVYWGWKGHNDNGWAASGDQYVLSPSWFHHHLTCRHCERIYKLFVDVLESLYNWAKSGSRFVCLLSIFYVSHNRRLSARPGQGIKGWWMLACWPNIVGYPKWPKVPKMAKKVTKLSKSTQNCPKYPKWPKLDKIAQSTQNGQSI